ncbi:MAG: Crp/Fnr family transcriptional regulator [Anaerovoracaceae bacterium]|jgi:CRP-like cAMP-binding protein
MSVSLPDRLASSLLFRGLNRVQINAALQALRPAERSYRRDELILHAGGTTERTGFVLTGSVTIESTDWWGGRTILSHVGSDGFFAETYATLPGKVLLVDVRANEDCRILFLETGRLPELIRATAQRAQLASLSQEAAAPRTAAHREQAPDWLLPFTANLLRISMQKNLALSGRSFHTAPKSARARIMSYLSSISLQRHAREFDIPFDRQQMADYLNLERTALSKELGRMRRDGLIDFRRNRFRLRSAADAAAR